MAIVWLTPYSWHIADNATPESAKPTSSMLCLPSHSTDTSPGCDGSGFFQALPCQGETPFCVALNLDPPIEIASNNYPRTNKSLQKLDVKASARSQPPIRSSSSTSPAERPPQRGNLTLLSIMWVIAGDRAAGNLPSGSASGCGADPGCKADPGCGADPGRGADPGCGADPDCHSPYPGGGRPFGGGTGDWLREDGGGGTGGSGPAGRGGGGSRPRIPRIAIARQWRPARGEKTTSKTRGNCIYKPCGDEQRPYISWHCSVSPFLSRLSLSNSLAFKTALLLSLL